MAATAVRLGNGAIPGGNGEYVEWGYITFDSDATVEVETLLSNVHSWSFGASGSGGNANTLSIDETLSEGAYEVVNGAITVDATASNSQTWTYRIWGH